MSDFADGRKRERRDGEEKKGREKGRRGLSDGDQPAEVDFTRFDSFSSPAVYFYVLYFYFHFYFSVYISISPRLSLDHAPDPLAAEPLIPGPN
jgi:hypothetical protein